MAVTDPALRFWLRYVASVGALCEEGDQSSLVVLPHELGAALDLPEETTVTADPELAREENATLLVPGHPALDRAADAVLSAGDVGRITLPWPAKVAPTPDALLTRARDQFPIDHGRIDAAGPPGRALLPVVRVGVLVTFTVSMEASFQERFESWVDGRTGLMVNDSVRRTLASTLPSTDAVDDTFGTDDTNRTDDTTAVADSTAGRSGSLSPNLAGAVRAAHRMISERATARSAVIATDTAGTRKTELARVERYYADALDSIARRRLNATADRVQLLDARAEATRAERVRRLAEVEEKYLSRVDLRPIRLHVIDVPAWELPVNVLRGPRRYPLSLYWMAEPATFAEVPCPSCGQGAPLVAAKDRLGCEHCVVAAVPNHPAPQAAPPPTTPKPAASKPPDPKRSTSKPHNPKQSTSKPSTPKPPTPKPSASKTSASKPPIPKPSLPEPTGPKRSTQPQSATRQTSDRTVRAARTTQPNRPPSRVDGNDFGLRFWDAVATQDRKTLGKIVAADSPAAAALRLYGPPGALLTAGVPAGERPVELSTRHLPAGPGALEVTTGAINTARHQYAYALRWSVEGRKPLVHEVQARMGDFLGSKLFSAGFPLVFDLPSHDLPPPVAALDPVAAEVWRVTLPEDGFSLTLRCLAAWWRAIDEPESVTSNAPTIAAAVTRMVSWRAGLRTPTDLVATRFGADPDKVRATEKPLQRALSLSDTRTW